jgi:hypothetical protein
MTTTAAIVARGLLSQQRLYQRKASRSLLPRRALVPEREDHRPDGPAGTAASGARIARDYSRRGVLVGRSHS